MDKDLLDDIVKAIFGTTMDQYGISKIVLTSDQVALFDPQRIDISVAEDGSSMTIQYREDG